MNTIPDQQAGPRQRRRAHSDEKAGAVAACAQAGMSMAAVAMAHGINANLLRRWVHEAKMKPRSEVVRANVVDGAKAQEPKPVFVPAPVPPAQAPDIRIELRRGPTTVTLTWPAGAASDCAVWMRELLR